MDTLQQKIVLIYISLNFLIFIKGFYETSKNNNAFKVTPLLTPLGIFVWGDAVVIGLFWFLISMVAFYLNSWYLFLSIISAFWFIRSIGEVTYWLNQQFSKIVRNPPQSLFGYSIFKNDSIWFAYQVVWQCVAVVSLICLFYFFSKFVNLV